MITNSVISGKSIFSVKSSIDQLPEIMNILNVLYKLHKKYLDFSRFISMICEIIYGIITIFKKNSEYQSIKYITST